LFCFFCEPIISCSYFDGDFVSTKTELVSLKNNIDIHKCVSSLIGYSIDDKNSDDDNLIVYADLFRQPYFSISKNENNQVKIEMISSEKSENTIKNTRSITTLNDLKMGIVRCSEKLP
jgi:hypothetical protein